MEIQQNRTQEIVTLHQEIVGSLKSSLEKAIRIGDLLLKQKEELQHGQFISWVDEHLPFTVRTAQNYMRLFRNKALVKNETVSHLTGAYNLLKQPDRYDDWRFRKASQQRLLTSLNESDLERTHCKGKYVDKKKWGLPYCLWYCHGQCAKFGKGDDLVEGGICGHPDAGSYGEYPPDWQSECTLPCVWVPSMIACPRDTKGL
jgi:hypothetical protein